MGIEKLASFLIQGAVKGPKASIPDDDDPGLEGLDDLDSSEEAGLDGLDSDGLEDLEIRSAADRIPTKKKSAFEKINKLIGDGRYTEALEKADKYFGKVDLGIEDTTDDEDSTPKKVRGYIRNNAFTQIISELSIADAQKYIFENWNKLKKKGIDPAFQLFLLEIASLQQQNEYEKALARIEETLTPEIIKKGKKEKKIYKYTYTDSNGKKQTVRLKSSAKETLEGKQKMLEAAQAQYQLTSLAKLEGFDKALEVFKADSKREFYEKKISREMYERIIIAFIFSEKGIKGVIAYLETDSKLPSASKEEIKQEYEISHLLKEKEYVDAETKAKKYYQKAPKYRKKDEALAKEYYDKAPKSKLDQETEKIYTAKLMDEAGKLDPEAAIAYLKIHKEEYEAKGVNVDFYITYFEIQGLLQDNKYAEAKDKIESLLEKGELENGARLTRSEVGMLKNVKKQVDEHDERVALAWQATLGFDDAETWLNKAKDQEDFDLIASFELQVLGWKELIEAKEYDIVEKQIKEILQPEDKEKTPETDPRKVSVLLNLLLNARMAKIKDAFKTAVEEKGFEAALKEFEANKEDHIKLIGEANYDKVIISVMMDEKGQGIEAVKKYIARDDVKARWEAKDIEEEMELFWQSQEIEALLKQEKFTKAEKLAKKYFHTEAGYEEGAYDSMMESIYGQKLIKKLEDMSLKQAKAYIKEHAEEYTKYDVNVYFYLLLIKIQELVANKQYSKAETILKDTLASGSFNTSLFLTGKETGKEITLKDNEVLRLAAQLAGLRAAGAKEDYVDIFVNAGLEKGWDTGIAELETNKAALVVLLGSNFRYQKFVEETKLAAKQTLEGIDATKAYIKANTKHLRELGIEPNDLLEKLDVEKSLEDEKFDEAIAKAKEYFQDKELDRMLEILHTQKTAKILEDLVTSEAKEYLETHQAELEAVQVDVNFQLFMLDIQSSFAKKEYNQVIKQLEIVLTNETYGKNYPLKSNSKRNIQLMLVRAKAMQIIEENAGKEEKAIQFVEDVLTGKIDLGFEIKGIEKELKQLKQTLIIQEKTQISAKTALEYLKANKTTIIIAFGGGKKGADSYQQQYLQLYIQDIQERKGFEEALAEANKPDFKEKYEKATTKKELDKYLTRLEFSKKLKDSVKEARAFVTERKDKLTSKELKYFEAQLEISELAEKGNVAYREILVLVEKKEAEYREAGVNVDAVKKQYEFQIVYSDQGSAKALEYLNNNMSDLKKAGMDVETLTFELELEVLLSEGSKEEGKVEAKFEELKSEKISDLFLKDLKQDSPEIYAELCQLLAANKLLEAAALIGSLQAQGKISQRVLAPAHSYIRYRRTAEEMQFVVTVEIHSPLDPFEKPEKIKAESIYFSYTGQGIDQESYIFNLQTMLMEVEDKNGIPYLSGIPGVTFKWGQMDEATINALYSFKNRKATQVTEKQLTQGPKRTKYDKTEKKPIALSWSETDEGSLLRAYAATWKGKQSLAHVFMYTKLGLAFHANKGLALETTNYLYQMAYYLEQRAEKPEEKAAYKRIREGLTGKGSLQNEDLVLFYRAALDDKNIDEAAITKQLQNNPKPEGLKRNKELPKVFKLKYTIKIDESEKYLDLTRALKETKIGQMLKAHAQRALADNENKLNQFNNVGFVLCLLLYLIKVDPENKVTYERIKDAYLNNKTISKEDLKTLSERIAKIDIYPELISQAFTDYQKTEIEIQGFAFVPTVRLVDGSFIPVDEKEAAKAVPTFAQLRNLPPGKLYGYKIYRLLALKKQWLQMGIPLASGDPGDTVLTPLTPADLLKAAEWMEKNKSNIRVHYPVYLDKELRTYLLSVEKSDALYDLAQKLLATDIREILKQEKAKLESKKEKTEQDKKRIRLLDKLLKNEDQLIRTIMMATQSGTERVQFDKDNALDEKDIAWLRSLEEKRKQEEKVYISAEEYALLKQRAKEIKDKHLALLVKSVRPDDAYSFNQEEIEDLRIMAKELKAEGHTTIDTKLLAKYMKLNPDNKGAKALWQRTQVVGLGAMEAQRKWYEMAPNMITTGLQAKPQRTNLVFLKRQWAKDNGLAKEAQKLRTQIDSLTKQIKEIKPDDPKLEELVYKRWLLQQELDSIINIIESDAVTKEFVEWFINSKYLQTDGVFDEATQWVISQGKDELYKEYYYDFITDQRMRKHNAHNLVIENAAAVFATLESDTIFSLDAVAEGDHNEDLLLSFKQALAASINLAITPEHIAEVAEEAGFAAEDDLSLEVKGLKLMAVNYYDTILRFQDPDAYYNYLFGDNPGLGVIMKHDIEILTKILPGSGIKNEQEELAKLETLLKNSAAFNDDGSLKEEHYTTLKHIGRKLNMAQGKEDVVGTKGKIIGEIESSEGILEYLIPPTDSDWREEFLFNLSQLPGDDWGTKILNQVINSNTGGEVAMKLIFQQVMFRFFMYKWIYVDLSKEVIDQLINGEGWDKLSGTKYLFHIFFWRSMAFIWYREFFEEVKQGHFGNALAIWYAINYLTMMGGQRSIWSNTMAFDAQVAGALNKFPLGRKMLQYLHKKAPNFMRRFAKHGALSRPISALQDLFRDFSGKPFDSTTHSRIREAGLIRFVIESINNATLNRKLDSETGKETTGSKWRRGIGQFFKGTLISPWLVVDHEARTALHEGGRLGRSLARVWTWPMDYAFGIADHTVDLTIRFGIKGAINATKRALSDKEKQHKAFNSHDINPTDTLAEIGLSNGKLKNTGAGEASRNKSLTREVEKAKKGEGQLAEILHYDPARKGFFIEWNGNWVEITKVRVIEGAEPGYIVERPYGATDADCKIWLVLPKDYNAQILKDLKEKARTNGQTKPESTTKLPTLTNQPLDATENQRHLDEVKPSSLAARQQGIELADSYQDKPAEFWTDYRTAANQYRNGEIGSLEMSKWTIAAARFATEERNKKGEIKKPGKTVRLVQQQSTEILAAPGNHLIHLETGGGKTLIDVLTAVQLSAHYNKVYIFTTGDPLVEQMAKDPLMRLLTGAGLKVGFLYSKNPDTGKSYTPQERQRVYDTCNVVVVDVSSHAFDLGGGEVKVPRGAVIADEWDLYGIETAETTYTIAGPKGETQNMWVDTVTMARTKNKWKHAHKVFQQVINNPLCFNQKTGEYTEAGIRFIEQGMKKYGGYDAFAQMQFEALKQAYQLYREKEYEGVEKRLSHQTKFKVKGKKEKEKTIIVDGEERTIKIVTAKSIVPLEESGDESPDKRFGNGLDEALRLVYGLPIERETMTVADIDIRKVFLHHRKVVGLSGSLAASHEVITHAYADLGFRVVEIPPYIPRAELHFGTDKAKVTAKLEQLALAAEETLELKDTGAHTKDIVGKIYVYGFSAAEAKQIWKQEILPKHPKLQGKKLSVVRRDRTFIFDATARRQAAAEEAVATAKSNRPVFIVLETPEQFKEYVEELGQREGVLIQTFTGEDYGENKAEIERLKGLVRQHGSYKLGNYEFKVKRGKLVAYEKGQRVKGSAQEIIREAKITQAGHAGTVTVTYFSRGLDIQVQAGITEAIARAGEASLVKGGAETNFTEGGLHVISAGAKTEAKILQSIGRGARNYFPGTSSVYTGDGDAVFNQLNEKIEKPALKAAAEAAGGEDKPVNLYDPNNKAINYFVNEAFRREYQRNFESMQRLFDRAALKYDSLATISDLSANLSDFNTFYRLAIESYLDLLLKEVGIETDADLKDETKLTELERKLNETTKGRKVTISRKIPSRAALIKALGEKLFNSFKLTTTEGSLDSFSNREFEYRDEGGQVRKLSQRELELRELVGEHYALVVDGMNAIQNLQLDNQSDDFKKKEMANLGKRATASLLEKLWKRMFPGFSAHHLRHDISITEIDLENAQRETKTQTETEIKVKVAKAKIPLSGKVKIKGEVYTYKADSSGKFWCYDAKTKTVGHLVFNSQGKASFIKLGSNASHAVAEPVSALILQVTDLVKTRQRKVDAIEPDKDAPTTHLDSAAFERANRNKNTLLKFDSLDCLKDVPVERFAELTGKEVKLLRKLARYNGKKAIKHKDYLAAEKILREKLGVDPAKFIEGRKLLRLGYYFDHNIVDFETLKGLFEGKLLKADVEVLWRQMFRFGRSNKDAYRNYFAIDLGFETSQVDQVKQIGAKKVNLDAQNDKKAHENFLNYLENADTTFIDTPTELAKQILSLEARIKYFRHSRHGASRMKKHKVTEADLTTWEARISELKSLIEVSSALDLTPQERRILLEAKEKSSSNITFQELAKLAVDIRLNNLEAQPATTETNQDIFKLKHLRNRLVSGSISQVDTLTEMSKLKSRAIQEKALTEAAEVEAKKPTKGTKIMTETTFMFLEGVDLRLVDRVKAGDIALMNLLRANGAIEVKIERKGGKEYSVEVINAQRAEEILAKVEKSEIDGLRGSAADKAAFMDGQKALIELAKQLQLNNPHLNIDFAIQYLLGEADKGKSLELKLEIPLLANVSKKDQTKALQLIETMSTLEKAQIVAEEKAKGGNWQKRAKERIDKLADIEGLKKRATERVLEKYHGVFTEAQLMETPEGRAEVKATMEGMFIEEAISRWEGLGLKPTYTKFLRRVFGKGSGNGGRFKRIKQHPVFSSPYSPAREMLLGAVADPLAKIAASLLSGKGMPSADEIQTAAGQGMLHWGVFGAKRGMFMYTAGISEGQAIHRVMLIDVAKGIAVAKPGEEGHAAFGSVTSLGALIFTMKYLQGSPVMLRMVDKVKFAKHLPLLIAMVAAELAGEMGEEFWGEYKDTGLGKSITFVAQGLKPFAVAMSPTSTLLHSTLLSENGAVKPGTATAWALDTTATLIDIVILTKVTYPMLMAGGTLMTTLDGAAAYETFLGASAATAPETLGASLVVAALVCWVTFLVEAELQAGIPWNQYDPEALKIAEKYIHEPRIKTMAIRALGASKSLGRLIKDKKDIILSPAQFWTSPLLMIELIFTLAKLGYINPKSEAVKTLTLNGKVKSLEDASPEEMQEIVRAYHEYFGTFLIPYIKDHETGEIGIDVIDVDGFPVRILSEEEANTMGLNGPANGEIKGYSVGGTNGGALTQADARLIHSRRKKTVRSIMQGLTYFRKGSKHEKPQQKPLELYFELWQKIQETYPSFNAAIPDLLLKYYEAKLDKLFSNDQEKAVDNHIAAIRDFTKNQGIETLKDLSDKLAKAEETKDKITAKIKSLEELEKELESLEIITGEERGVYYLVSKDKEPIVSVIVAYQEVVPGQGTLFIKIGGMEEPILVPINGPEEINPSYIQTIVINQFKTKINKSKTEFKQYLDNNNKYIESLELVKSLVEHSNKCAPEVTIDTVLKNYRAHLLKPLFEERRKLCDLLNIPHNQRPTARQLLDLSGIYTKVGERNILHPDLIPDDFAKWAAIYLNAGIIPCENCDKKPARFYTNKDVLDWVTASKLLLMQEEEKRGECIEH